MRRLLLIVMLVIVGQSAMAQGNRHRTVPITTDNPMVHDPVMAFEDDVYHLYCTGIGIQHMTSKDRRTWTIDPTPVMTVMPQWTRDSVPGFEHHVWAPDVIRWHNRWWLAYSCSTFGKNGSAIGLLSTPSLSAPVAASSPLVNIAIIGMPLIRVLSLTTMTNPGWRGARFGTVSN